MKQSKRENKENSLNQAMPIGEIDSATHDDTSTDTHAICYPNSRFCGSRAARPDDENVEKARNWVQENEK